MLCEKCHEKEAVVFYKETINGKTRSVSLCKKCASETEAAGEIGKIGSVNPFEDVNSLFGSLFGIPSYHKKAIGEVKKCSLCGSMFSDLVSSGKVGCPECYKIFADELAPTIAKIHGTTVHSGSSPERYREGFERKAKIKELESALRSAVAAEEYEKAAILRDELKALREETSEF